MQEYRAYMIAPDGHIVRRTEPICADDEAAQSEALRLMDGHDVELWQGARKLARFYHTD
jgi:hypothetical protein